jgi:murein DD-endopeptidase MepM/ murein hydrolase activator NlpD
MVRDGLPHFGAMRDDWMGAPRRHKGIDIYIDKVTVQSVAGGKVVGTGLGPRSGGWATIRHGQGVDTTYVHISSLRIETGDVISRGQPIAAIDGALGNAIQPQLHFELRIDGESVDPVPFLFDQASEELREKITLATERLAELEHDRATKVRLMVDEARE